MFARREIPFAIRPRAMPGASRGKDGKCMAAGRDGGLKEADRQRATFSAGTRPGTTSVHPGTLSRPSLSLLSLHAWPSTCFRTWHP